MTPAKRKPLALRAVHATAAVVAFVFLYAAIITYGLFGPDEETKL